MTRKGLFDGMLQGCIPVVFSCLSASCMYTWHWEEEYWQRILIEFDMDLVIQRKLNPIAELKRMVANDSTFILTRQKLLRERVFQLQYSLVGYDVASLQTNASAPIKSCSWPMEVDKAVPIKDAYDIAIDWVLDWHAGGRSRVRKASTPHCWNGMLNSSASPPVCVPLPKSIGA